MISEGGIGERGLHRREFAANHERWPIHHPVQRVGVSDAAPDDVTAIQTEVVVSCSVQVVESILLSRRLQALMESSSFPLLWTSSHEELLSVSEQATRSSLRRRRQQSCESQVRRSDQSAQIRRCHLRVEVIGMVEVLHAIHFDAVAALHHPALGREKALGRGRSGRGRGGGEEGTGPQLAKEDYRFNENGETANVCMSAICTISHCDKHLFVSDKPSVIVSGGAWIACTGTLASCFPCASLVACAASPLLSWPLSFTGWTNFNLGAVAPQRHWWRDSRSEMDDHA
jgi:hypothetical protein